MLISLNGIVEFVYLSMLQVDNRRHCFIEKKKICQTKSMGRVMFFLKFQPNKEPFFYDLVG